MSESETPRPDPEQQPQEGRVRSQHVTARVPESVADGVFSTGVIVLTGMTEFVLDFIQNLGGPPKLVQRVIIPHAVMPQFIQAMRHNMEMYQRNFGTPAQPPRPPEGGRRPTLQEIYDELKIADEKLVGAYANGLMVGHSASEFKLDFLTNLPPHSAVSARVYLSAPQIPRMIESLSKTLEQLQQRIQQQQQQQRRGVEGRPDGPRPADEPPGPPPDAT